MTDEQERPGEGTKFLIDRKLFSSDIWFDSPWMLKVWIYLIGNAAHGDFEWMGTQIKRGQLVRSYRKIAKDCSYRIGYRIKKPSLDTIRRICEDLMKAQRIVLRTVQGGTLITILKYDEMQQFSKHEPNYEPNDEPYSHRTDIVQNINYKEEKKELSSPEPSQNGSCPHQEIVSAYHEILPELPKVKIWNEARQAILRSRWKEDVKRQTLDWWKRFFGYVKKSDFLTGKKTDFRADLEWLIRPKNFPKVIEGRYHTTTSRDGGGPVWH